MAAHVEIPMRDLKKAREAYEVRDGEASIAAHEAVSSHNEEHKRFGEYLKSIVYGGMDGIITTFAVVSGATGGGLGIDVILILGFSSIFADALSMGVGDALSSKAENEFIMGALLSWWEELYLRKLYSTFQKCYNTCILFIILPNIEYIRSIF